MSQSDWEKRKKRALQSEKNTVPASTPSISSSSGTGKSAGSSGSEWEKRKKRALQSESGYTTSQMNRNSPTGSSGISSRDDWYRVYRGRVGNQQAKYNKLKTLLDTMDDYDIADSDKVKKDLTDQLAAIESSPEYVNASYAKKYAGKTSAQLGTIAKQATDPGEKSWLEYVSKATESDEDRKFRIARNTDEKRRLEEMMAEAPDTGSFLKSVYTSTPAAAGTQNAKQKDEIAKKYGYSSWKEATDRLDAIEREMYFDQNARKYDAVKTAEDFEAQSKYDESKGKGVEAGAHAQYNRLNQANMEGAQVGPNLLRDKYDYMTEEDLATYNYIYNTEGKEAAEDYLDYMSYHYNELRQYGIQQDVSNWMNEGIGDTWIGGALASNASVPLKLASGIAMVDVAGQKLRNKLTGEDRPVDFNTGAWTARSLSNGLREGTAQNLNEISGTIQLDETRNPVFAALLNGKGLGDVYSLGMSMADSGVVAALTPIIGPTGVALLATSAGADGIQTALESGATDDQAITMGLINATAEALFEKVSLDNLIKSDPKKLLTAMLQQGGVEASEEASTSIANLIGDYIVMAEKSEWKKDIAEYMNAGDDVKTATWKALWGKVAEIGMDAIGGFITGGLMGGGSTVIQNAQARMQYSDQVGSLLEDAASYGVDTKATQKAQKRMEAEKTVPGSTIRQVMSQTEDAKVAQAESYANEAAQMLAEYGQEVDVTETAQAIGKAMAGQELTKEELATIDRSDMAPIVLAEMQIQHAIESTTEQETSTDTSTQPATEAAQEAQEAQIPEAVQVEGETEKVAPAANLPTETDAEAIANEAATEEAYQPDVLEEDAADIDTFAKQYANPTAYKATFQGNQDPTQYDVAYRAAYEMGMTGEPEAQMKRSKAVQYLTQEQQIDAYREGEAVAKAQAESAEAFLRSKGTRTGERKRGNVKAIGGVNIKTLTAKFNDSQRKAYRILDRIAEVTGINIVLYESKVGATGQFEGEQGRFARSTPDTIYIDINAGLSGVSDVGNMAKYTMLATFSHEFTHFCEAWNPIRYNELRKLVFETMEAKGVSVEDRIDALMAEDATLTREAASREVVAEAMVDILPDANFIEQLATKHQSLFQKLVERLKEFLASIRDLFNGMEKSEYASVLKEELDGTVRYMESIVKLFDNVAVEAVETMQESAMVADTMSNTEAFADSAIAVQNQIRPPYNEGTKAFNAFADGLSEEARKTFDLFYGFYDLSRITNATNLQGKTVKKINISAPFVSVSQWNDKVRNDAKWGETAKKLAAFLDADTRKRMNMNEDGTLNETPLEKAFKMQKSIAQRLVDSLPVEDIDAEYTIDDSVTVTLPTAKARQSVGGEAYRRALIGETRKLYHEGKLKQVSIGTMSKDRWGSLGFLAANGKTTASGDFTTVCPQMMFNKGCFYCYRRAAMESGVNNKLVAEKVWYAGEILRIKDKDIADLNRNGGLRIQSFGDWMPHFSAMLADVLYDAELRGLQVKIITKEPSMIEYLASLKDQGIGKNLYFNLSADYVLEKAPAANNTGGPDSLEHINPDRPFVRREGQAWWKRAMAVEEAAKYRAKYDWVNTRIAATTTEEFIRGLKDPTVDVVTWYHGNIRQYDRIDSVTGQTQVEVEALGDAGMPRWVFLNGKWNLVYKGKTKTHQQLAERVQAEGLELEYYAKTCCQTGRCSECEGKCGKISRSMTMKNATNRDAASVSYWRTMQNIQDESLEISQEEWEAMGGTQFQRRRRRITEEEIYTTHGVHWALEEGIISRHDAKAVWHAIDNGAKTKYNGYSKTKDGRIYVSYENRIMVVYADRYDPAIEEVYEVHRDYETEIDAIRREIINAQGVQSQNDKSYEIVRNTFGPECFTRYAIEDFTYYGRKNRRRKRDYSSLFAEEVREDEEVASQKQRRSAPKLSDREVLEMAAEGLEGLSLTEAETNSLGILRKKLADIAPISEEIDLHEQNAETYAESDPDFAQKERNRAATLKAKRTRKETEILAGANGPIMRKVLQKARSIVERTELSEYRAARDESELAKRYKAKIEKDVRDLITWGLKPDTKNALKHIPEGVKGPVMDFLEAIDFSSQRKLKGGADTQKDIKLAAKLNAIKNALDGGKRSILSEDYKNVVLSEAFFDRLESLITEVNNMGARVSNMDAVINEMSAEGLKNLSGLVTNLKKLLTDFNQFHKNTMFAHVYEAGRESTDFLRSMKPIKTRDKFMMWDLMRPGFVWERFGRGGVSIWKEFVKAESEQTFHAKEVSDFADKTYTAQEVREWEKDVRTIKLSDGSKVQMTVAQIMAVYKLRERKQALGHLLGQGLRVPKTDGIKNVDEGHFLTEADLDAICAELNERQKAVADKLQRYMQDKGSAWGNQVTMVRFGEKLFGEPNYYPIHIDNSEKSQTLDAQLKAQDLYALLNMGFTKQTQENASNRLVVYSIFDEFSTHMANMATYNAYALPVIDAIKWFNYSEGTGQGVRSQLARVYGREKGNGTHEGAAIAEQWILNQIKSINGTNDEHLSKAERRANKITSTYNRAQVAFNLSVVMQQPFSVIRATSVISPVALMAGEIKKWQDLSTVLAEMDRHSGIALRKNMGFYSVNLSTEFTKLIKHDDTIIDKITDVSMWGAEKADRWAWATMWQACKYEVEHKQNIKPSDDRYWDAVNDLFNEVIYKTQVVDSSLVKPEFMTNKSAFIRPFTAFMMEPLTAINGVTSVFDKMRIAAAQDGKGKAWKKYKGALLRAFSVYSASAVVNALVTALRDALRDDDKYIKFDQKWVNSFFDNLGEEFNPITKIPMLADAYTSVQVALNSIATSQDGKWWKRLAQWTDGVYENTTALQSLVDSFTKVLKVWLTDTKYTDYGRIYAALKAVSGLSGVPLANASREVITAWNTTVGSLYPDKKIITYASDWVSAEERASLYDVFVSGDTERIQRIESLSKDKDELHAAIRKALRENDPRIKEAAKQRYNGDIAEYTRISEEIGKEKHFAAGDINAAIETELAILEPEGEKSSPKEKGRYKASDFAAIAKDGEWELADAIIDDMVATKVKNGQTQKNAESNTKSSIRTELKEDVFAGSLSKENAIHALTIVGDLDKDEATAQYQDWMTEQKHGYSNDEVKEAYMEGNITQADAIEMRMAYTGKSRSEVAAEVAKWSTEKSTGYAYDDIKEAFLEGDLTSGEAIAKYKAYGVKDADARDKVAALEFQKRWPGTDGISASAVRDYQKYCASAGVSGTIFYKAYQFASDTHADVDKNGNSINWTRRKKVLKYIDSLPLNTKQKDAIYYALGWAKSTLDEAPWH